MEDEQTELRGGRRRNGEDGTWQTVRTADEIPGVRWFFETSHSGGAGYWLDLDACAARGLRLIRRPCDGADSPQLAVVTQERGAVLTQRNGDRFDFRPVPWGHVLCALRADEERVYVFCHGTFCYVKRSDVDLISVPDQEYPSAFVTAEGKRPGAVVRSYREADGTAAAAAEWPVGTTVVILDRADGFCFAEGLGRRGWIPEPVPVLRQGSHDGPGSASEIRSIIRCLLSCMGQ